MGRIVAIDYGLKRVGIAVTDPLQLIATPLITVATVEILHFLQAYTAREVVDTIVVGMPKRLHNVASSMTKTVEKFIHTLQKHFPKKSVVPQDERFSSKIAHASMIEAGFKKKDRRNKPYLDKVSATIILQSFLAHRQHRCTV